MEVLKERELKERLVASAWPVSMRVAKRKIIVHKSWVHSENGGDEFRAKLIIIARHCTYLLTKGKVNGLKRSCTPARRQAPGFRYC